MKTTNKALRYAAPAMKVCRVSMEHGFAVSTDAWGDKELNPWGLSTQSNDYNE